MVEKRIGLIIADDSNIMIECFRHWIEDTIKINLIGVVHKTEELLSLMSIEENAIVLTSYHWVLKQGKSTISRVIEDNPKASIALCLSSINYEAIHRLIKMGIKGFFGDLTTKEELIKGLSDIYNFNYYMGPEILTEFIKVKNPENGGSYPERTSYLTKREREILELVLSGKNSKDIARKLNISKRTVDGHRANINNKFGVRNTAQLYKKAHTYMYSL